MPFPAVPSDRLTSWSDQIPSLSSRVMDFLFKPDASGFQRCLGTQKQTAKQMAALKAMGYSVVNAHYSLGQATYGPDTGMPDSNAVKTIVNGDWGSRWSNYKNINYLFLLSTVAGNPRIHNGSEKWWLLDLNSQQCFGRIVADILTDIVAVPGTGGVFLDELIPLTQAQMDVQDPRFYGSSAADPAAWSPLPPWTAQQQAWLSAIVRTLHGSGLWVIANLGHLALGWPNYAPPTGADCVMVEQFANRNIYQGGDWALAMNRCLKFTNAGTPLILQSSTAEVDRSFFFCSALLLDNVLPNLCDGDSAAPYWWPEMEWARQALGKTMEGINRTSFYSLNSIFARDFSNGSVTVNPSSLPISFPLTMPGKPLVFSGGGLLTDAAIDASGGYIGGKMTVGQPVFTVTLPPGTGTIILRDSIPPPAATAHAVITLPDGSMWSGDLKKQ